MWAGGSGKRLQVWHDGGGGKGQAGVLWLSGRSGWGKGTIATRVVEEMERRGIELEYIDGDALRAVFPSTGFTREEREEHERGD